MLVNTMKGYFLVTMGCQMNKYDSEVIGGILEGQGYVRAESMEDADLVVFNTCCVRESADEKAFGRANAAAALKRKKPDLILGFGGCLAQKERENVFLRARSIDFAFGPRSLNAIPRLISLIEDGHHQAAAFDKTESKVDIVNVVRDKPLSAWVAISAGCSNFCTYCIVPFVRGAERSRPMEEIIGEVEGLSEQGYVEINLLGQNVNTYGCDLGGRSLFAGLLEAVSGIDKIKRIRFTTSHPRDFSDEMIDKIAGLDKVCKYFHIPMQSGSNRVLELMNRGYDRDYYLGLIERIRGRIPNSAISSDFIVGFPGEEKDDFERTIEAVNTVGFDQVFTFLYSPRQGTKAATMPGQVGTIEKKLRFDRLSRLVTEVTGAQNFDIVGKRLEVLCEGPSKKDQSLMTGRAMSNKIVHFEGFGDIRAGVLVEVEITKALSSYLKGNAVGYRDA